MPRRPLRSETCHLEPFLIKRKDPASFFWIGVAVDVDVSDALIKASSSENFASWNDNAQPVLFLGSSHRSCISYRISR